MALYDSTGSLFATYDYDAWGKVLRVSDANGNLITSTTNFANINPFRYRGYYYDTDSELYYLQSRYYDPTTGRFVNADGYISTGTGLMGYNMFSYCNNNPVNACDPSGKFFFEFIDELGRLLQNYGSAFLAPAAASQIDGPAPGPADAGALIAAGVILSAFLLQATAVTIAKAPPISLPKVEEKEKDFSAHPESTTVIYRYGGTNPGNLTPSQRDVELYPMTGKGLSFSTTPKPGAAMTTIEALNSTGIVYAVPDGGTHVSVYPIGGTLEDWHNAGSASVWTAAVKSVVVKWDGRN